MPPGSDRNLQDDFLGLVKPGTPTRFTFGELGRLTSAVASGESAIFSRKECLDRFPKLARRNEKSKQEKDA